MRSDLFSNTEAGTGQLGFTMQNGKMLKATVNNTEFYARRGAMVGYQGNIRFEYQGITGGPGGGGMKDKLIRAAKAAVTGEGVPLMKVAGQGDVFLADAAADIFLIDLEGADALSINGPSILAFESTLNYDIKLVGNAGAFAGAGLFNTVVFGTGRVAVVSHGHPVVLDCSQQPTYVDPNAAICWSANLNVSLQRSEGFGSLFGRTSGESLQMMFHGPGFVVVQPYEWIAGVGQTGTEGGSSSPVGGAGGVLGGILGGR